MKVTDRRHNITRSSSQTIEMIIGLALMTFIALATILGAFHIMPS